MIFFFQIIIIKIYKTFIIKVGHDKKNYCKISDMNQRFKIMFFIGLNHYFKTFI